MILAVLLLLDSFGIGIRIIEIDKRGSCDSFVLDWNTLHRMLEIRARTKNADMILESKRERKRGCKEWMQGMNCYTIMLEITVFAPLLFDFSLDFWFFLLSQHLISRFHTTEAPCDFRRGDHGYWYMDTARNSPNHYERQRGLCRITSSPKSSPGKRRAPLHSRLDILERCTGCATETQREKDSIPTKSRIALVNE
jgi:hypothetical protein